MADFKRIKSVVKRLGFKSYEEAFRVTQTQPSKYLELDDNLWLGFCEKSRSFSVVKRLNEGHQTFIANVCPVGFCTDDKVVGSGWVCDCLQQEVEFYNDVIKERIVVDVAKEKRVLAKKLHIQHDDPVQQDNQLLDKLDEFPFRSEDCHANRFLKGSSIAFKFQTYSFFTCGTKGCPNVGSRLFGDTYYCRTCSEGKEKKHPFGSIQKFYKLFLIKLHYDLAPSPSSSDFSSQQNWMKILNFIYSFGEYGIEWTFGSYCVRLSLSKCWNLMLWMPSDLQDQCSETSQQMVIACIKLNCGCEATNQSMISDPESVTPRLESYSCCDHKEEVMELVNLLVGSETVYGSSNLCTSTYQQCVENFLVRYSSNPYN